MKSSKFKSAADLKKSEASRLYKLGFDETGLREILDPSEIKGLKQFEKELRDSEFLIFCFWLFDSIDPFL